jgi:glutathione S-transferase
MAFEHEAVSVFSNFERFRQLNAVVKAPTLVCDDGDILMDSALILQFVEGSLQAPSPLWSKDPALRLRQYRTVGFASAACEKTVQLTYETQLRPPEAQHEPWKARVRSQLQAAFAALESLTPETVAGISAGDLDHASIWSAIVWRCTCSLIPAEVLAANHPHLVRLSRQCEALAVFRRYRPDGPGVPGLGSG